MKQVVVAVQRSNKEPLADPQGDLGPAVEVFRGGQGFLTFEDQRKAERRASEEINRSKKVKILALLEQFSGWGREGYKWKRCL